jgi:hypothetical protein
LVLQNGEVCCAVRVGQEDILPVVPALGDVMGQTGYDNPGDSRHEAV